MIIKDIKLHVFKTQTPALVTSYTGLFKGAGIAGVIQYSLLRIITDTAIEGHYIIWSETAAGRPNTLAETLRAMKPHLVGEDPLNREKIWHILGSLWYGQRGPAFAAVDIALWDIAGKVSGLPIYKLLGGYRKKIRAYASGNVPKDVESIVSIARDLVERGYRAMKLHPIPIEACSPLRKVVGPDIDLIYDAVFSHTREQAIKIGRELQRLNFYWYEAPLPPDDIEGYIGLTKKLDIPVTVELIHPSQFREYVYRGAVSCLRTLSGNFGGITEMRKAASLCETFGMNWEPHAYGGTLYQAAVLHAQLATRNTTLFELPIEDGKEGHFDIGTEDSISIDRDGYVDLPDKPGLGFRIDWDEVQKGDEVII